MRKKSSTMPFTCLKPPFAVIRRNFAITLMVFHAVVPVLSVKFASNSSALLN